MLVDDLIMTLTWCCVAGASSFQEWFASGTDGQRSGPTAGTLSWDSTKGLYMFTEAPIEGSSMYHAAAFEVRDMVGPQAIALSAITVSHVLSPSSMRPSLTRTHAGPAVLLW